MRFLAALLAPLLLAGACASRPCPADVDLVEIGEGFVNDGVIASASIDAGRAVVSIAESTDPTSTVTLRFVIVEDAPPALPPPGAAVTIGQANCFGEGCDDTFWSVPGSFEVGTVALLDDRPSSLRPEGTHLGIAYPVHEPDVCDDGDGDTDPAAVVVNTDDGKEVIAPGEQRLVSIEGQDWQVLGGRAERRSSFQIFPCADCAGPGPSSRTSASAVLYLRASP